jgi:hypothetical protein
MGATIAAMAVFASGWATPPEHILPGFKLATPPVIDGVVDTDKEWAGVPSGSGFVDQMTGQKAPVDMRFWIAYDEKYIYFAAKMQDPDPKGIKANNYRQNVDMTGDDDIALDVDPYGSFTDFNAFWMNPKGATTVFITGGRAPKNEWVGEFVAKGRITKDGWEVEARIPWALMSLPAAGVRTLRINVVRIYARTSRWLTWCYTGGGDVEQVGRWTGVLLPPAPPRLLHLLPYGYLGLGDNGSAIVDGGLDLKTGLTDRLELVGTYRPDFRNIEENILSLDFTHYQRFAAESRPFFLEGGNDIDPMGTGLFLSQRIPDFDAGLKLYGKMNDKTTVGLLDADTFGQSNAFAGSAQYAPDHFSQFSFTSTSYDAAGEHNAAGALGYMRQIGPFNLSSTAAGSSDTAAGDGSDFSASLYYSRAAWSASGNYQQVSSSFSPALGYVPYVDVKQENVYLGYDCPLQHGPLREVAATVDGFNYDYLAGSPFFRSVGASAGVAWRNGAALQFIGDEDCFEGIPEHTYSLYFGKDPNDPNRNWSVGTTWGDQLGEYYFIESVGTAYRPIQHLQLGLTYQYKDLDGIFDQAILTATYDIGRHDTVSARLVEQDGNWNAFFAYNRTGNRGPEYYLIVGDPNAVSFHPSLIFKMVVPFELKL